jgi:hypothetical protein
VQSGRKLKETLLLFQPFCAEELSQGMVVLSLVSGTVKENVFEC